MNRTITYLYQGELYHVNVSNPYKSDRYAIVVNQILCNYAREDKMVHDIDSQLARAIDRYKVEKAIGLIS